MSKGFRDVFYISLFSMILGSILIGVSFGSVLLGFGCAYFGIGLCGLMFSIVEGKL